MARILMYSMKRAKMQTHDGVTPYNLVFLISDLQTSEFQDKLLISSSSLAILFFAHAHTHMHARAHTHSSYLALSQPLLPLSSLLAEPLQQLQLLSAPVPLSDLKLTGRKAETKRDVQKWRKRWRDSLRMLKMVQKKKIYL